VETPQPQWRTPAFEEEVKAQCGRLFKAR